MKKLRSVFILFFLFIAFKSSSQDFQLDLLNVDFSNNQLIITYSIDNKSTLDKFLIRVEIKRQNGEPIQPKTVTGEIGNNIKPGNTKTIIWDLVRILSILIKILS